MQRICFLAVLLVFFMLQPVHSMPLPGGQSFFEYSAEPVPVLNSDPSLSLPIGVGSSAYAGEYFTLRIALDQFEGPVDIYFGILAGPIDPENIYILGDDAIFHPLSEGVRPWKTDLSSPVDETLFRIPLYSLPPGRYEFYLVVTPAGDFSKWYLWKSSLTLPGRVLLAESKLGPGGGEMVIDGKGSNFDGTTISIPPGALSEDTIIRVYEVTTEKGLHLLDVTPYELQISVPLQITINYAGLISPDVDSFSPMRFSDDDGGWKILEKDNVDFLSKTIVFSTDRPGEFRVTRDDYLDISLLQADGTGKAVASVRLSEDLSGITPQVTGAEMGGYDNLRAWIEAEWESLGLACVSRITSADGSLIGEEVLSYSILKGQSPDRYIVEVKKNGEEFYRSNMELPMDTIIDEWLNCYLGLFTFDKALKKGETYIVETGLYVLREELVPDLISGKRTGYFNLVPGRAKIHNNGFLASQSVIDINKNGVVDLYDRPMVFNGGVSPLSAGDRTKYTFYVEYYDLNGDPPAMTDVIINGSIHEMYLGSGSPSDGVYFFNTYLSPGTHRFHFVFQDSGYGGVVTTKEVDAPKVTTGLDNEYPSLLNCSLSPVSGFENTGFTLFTEYFDWDGDSPSGKNLYIKGRHYSMEFYSGSPDAGTYRKDVSLGQGCYCYNIGFSDSNGNGVRLPSLGNFYGPAVSGVSGFSPSSTAVCPKNRNPELSDGNLTPPEGDECDYFTFTVHYFDPDGDAPSTRYVYVNGVAHWMSLAEGVSSDGTYKATFRLKPGTYTYYFYFKDGHCGADRYPLIGALDGPEVSPAAFYSPGPVCN